MPLKVFLWLSSITKYFKNHGWILSYTFTSTIEWKYCVRMSSHLKAISFSYLLILTLTHEFWARILRRNIDIPQGSAQNYSVNILIILHHLHSYIPLFAGYFSLNGPLFAKWICFKRRLTMENHYYILDYKNKCNINEKMILL